MNLVWLVGGVILLGLPAPAQAGLTSFDLKGDHVEAVFLALDPQDDCIEYFVVVTAAASVFRTSPPPTKAPDPTTVLAASLTNICTGFPLIVVNEAVFVAPEVARNLRFANLQTTIRGFNVVDQQSYNFDIDLQWIAEGPAVRENTHDSFRDPSSSLIIRTHDKGVTVPARASGTVICTGTDLQGNQVNANFTPEPTDDAQILRSDSSQLIIEF
jgi:hypothetical protein